MRRSCRYQNSEAAVFFYEGPKCRFTKKWPKWPFMAEVEMADKKYHLRSEQGTQNIALKNAETIINKYSVMTNRPQAPKISKGLFMLYLY